MLKRRGYSRASLRRASCAVNRRLTGWALALRSRMLVSTWGRKVSSAGMRCERDILDTTANSISAVSSSWRWIRACAGRCSLAHPCLGSYRARRLTAVPGMPALLGHSIMEWLSRTHGATASDPRLRQQLAEAQAKRDFTVQRVRRAAFTVRRRVSSGLRIGHRVAVRSDRPAQPALTVSRQPPSAVRAAVLRRSAVRRVSASCALRFRAGYARSRGVWPADDPI